MSKPNEVTSRAHEPTSARLSIDVGIVVWASFLAACLATMVFFAFFDPLLLAHDGAPPRWLSDRMTGYAIGFFFFWLTCALASALTALLVETRTEKSPSDD